MVPACHGLLIAFLSHVSITFNKFDVAGMKILLVFLHNGNSIIAQAKMIEKSATNCVEQFSAAAVH